MSTHKKTTPRKKPSTMAAAPAKRRRRSTVKVPATRRRKPAAKKGFLSDMFNPAMATAGFNSTLSGALGGALGGVLDKFITTPNQNLAAGYKLAGGFLIATVMKKPNLGAGLAGVGAYQLLQATGMLAEDYADDLEALPLVMNDDGGYLQEDYLYDNGNGMYSNAGFSNLNYL